MSYLLASDIHFHSWTTFASTNPDGINSRLQITMDELKRAAKVHEAIGGSKVLVIAGDVFHTRGAVKTSVMNPVIDLFRHIREELGYEIHILSGNHDLESKESLRLSSSVTALEPFARVYSNSLKNDDLKLVFVPWFADVKSLKEELESIAFPERCEYDLIIHAPVDDVIFGLPSHGLDAKYLSGLGFKRVFSGHYHCHKDLGNGVYSIGATTHQTFGDIGTKAGFLTVGEDTDEVIFHSSHAPRFVDINCENFEDAALLVDGNYVRCQIDLAKESDVALLREQFEQWGAKGVVINQVKNSTVTERSGAPVTTKAMSLESSISSFVASKGYSEEVDKFCQQILSEVEEVE